MSKSKSQTLIPLLEDVRQINQAHLNLRTGLPGRQWNLSGLNRSAIILSVSAWEAYVEDLAKECVELLRPPAQPVAVPSWPSDAWPSIQAATLGAIKNFNTPDSKKVIGLFSKAIGLNDVSQGWHYRGCSQVKAVKHLDGLLELRHKIAHGVNPRPIVHNSRANWAPAFIERLADCTEAIIVSHMTNILGVVPPW